MLKIVSVTVVDGTLLNPSSNSSYSQPGVHGQKIRSVPGSNPVEAVRRSLYVTLTAVHYGGTIKSSERFVGIFKFFRIFAEVNFLKSENSSQLYNQIIIRSR